MGFRKFRPRKKECHFCQTKVNYVDYKDVDLLRKYVSANGRIIPRRTTGTCAKHQRVLASAIKRSREMALLPYVAE